MRSSNPALSEKRFHVRAYDAEGTMTLQGTATKALLLILIVIIAGAMLWNAAPPLAGTTDVIQEEGKLAQLTDVPGMIYG